MKKPNHQTERSTGNFTRQEIEEELNHWVGALRSIAEDPEDSSMASDRKLRENPKNISAGKKPDPEQNEKQFRILLESSTDGILTCSSDGTSLYTSPSIGQIFGHTVNKLFGEKGPEFVHPDERESTALLWAELIKSPGKNVRIEVRYLHKDGSWHWLEAMAANLLHESSIKAVVVNLRDIHERKTADELVQKAGRKYKDLLATIEGIVWEADARTLQCSFVSKHAERLLGYTVGQWCQEPDFWKDHLHPDDRGRVVDACLRGVMEKSGHDLEYRMLASDGRIVWLRDLVSVIVENDQAVKLRGIMVNNTQKKRADLLET